MEDVNKACANYLKSRKGAKRIVKLVREKYESLGDVRGSIKLTDISKDEVMFLRGLFRQDFSHLNSVSINLKDIANAFEGGIYGGINLPKVLEYYYDEPILSKSEKSLLEFMEWETFLIEMEQTDISSDLQDWIFEDRNRDNKRYHWLKKLYGKDKNKLKSHLVIIDKVVKMTKDSYIGLSLPHVAAIATKDPHALDKGSILRNLLVNYLSYSQESEIPKTGEEEDILLKTCNFLTDASIRTVLTYGLLAYDSDNKELGWESFALRNEAFALTGYNLRAADRIVCKSTLISCYENPAVFYAHITNKPSEAAICTSGQINSLVYRLLDIVCKEDVSITYSGDFDPEGLLIADKLRQRYSKIKLADYTEENYLKSMSNNIISERRLSQLCSLRSESLAKIAMLLMTHKKAGYQESLLVYR